MLIKFLLSRFASRLRDPEDIQTIFTVAVASAVSIVLTYVVVLATVVSVTSTRPLVALAPLPAFNLTEGK